MSQAAKKPTMKLAERFWSLAKAMPHKGDPDDPVAVVRHVLTILDALDRGEQANVVSVATVSFLKLLRQSEIKGDLSYASPEQIRGEMVDERSLVFSVGVLLFERLTGRHPFGAEASGRRVSRISKVEFGSGVNYFPTVPGGLRQVLMRAMGPFPEERWENLRQLRVRLEQFVEKESPVAFLPGTSSGRAPSGRAPTFLGDESPTRVVDMQRVMMDRVTKGRASTNPAAIDSGRASTASGETDTRTAQVSTLPKNDEAEFEPRVYIKPKSKITPLVWAGAGAAIASVAFFLMQGNPSATTTAAQKNSVDDAKTAVTKHSAGEQQKTSPAVTTKTAAATTEVTSKAVPPVAKPSTGPITIDPRSSTDQIAELLTPCFTSERRTANVRFGVSVLYGKRDGKVKATYYSGKGAVTKDEKKCIDTSMKRLIADPSPKKILGYNMLFHADGATIKLL